MKYQWLKPEPYWPCNILFLISGMDDEENEICPLHEMLDDKMRVGYFKSYLAEVSKAIRLAAYFSSFQIVPS